MTTIADLSTRFRVSEIGVQAVADAVELMFGLGGETNVENISIANMQRIDINLRQCRVGRLGLVNQYRVELSLTELGKAIAQAWLDEIKFFTLADYRRVIYDAVTEV